VCFGGFLFVFFFLGAAVLYLVLGGIIVCVVALSGEGVDCFLFVRIADGSWIGCFVSVICSLGWCGVICDGVVCWSIAGPSAFGVFGFFGFFFFIFGVLICPGCIVMVFGFGPSSSCVRTEYNCLIPFVSTSVSTIVVSWYFLMS
jgi:hypothetical protein